MPKNKDVNAQLQEWVKKGLKPDEQVRQVQSWLSAAKPFIFAWAEEIGQISNANQKADALRDFFKSGVTQLSPDDRMAFKDELCQAINISKGQWAERLKSLNGHKKKDEDDRDEPIFITGGWFFDHFIGLEYDQEEDRTFFAVRFPDGHVEDRLERVKISDRTYMPMPTNNIIRKRVILLPSEMTELRDEKDLLFAIKVHNARYFDFGSDETFEQLCTIYPFFTYLASQFRTLPYLRALGDYGTGKSRLLKTIGPICHQPIMTNAGSSASSLFRILDLFQPASTLVLDEADFNNSDEASMIGKILNGGNENGVSILRSEKNQDGNFDAAAFNVFGPKIIGMRSEFQDKATASRCLTKEMIPMMPHPRIPLDLPPVEAYERECLALRNALHTYRMHNLQKDQQVDLGAIDRAMDSRTAQVTVSLLTVMKSEEGRDLVREYLKKVTEERKGDRYAEFTARVLEGVMLAWAWGPVSDRPEDANRVYLKDIAMATNQVVDEQNRQMGEMDDEDDVDGKKKSFKAKSRKISGVMKKFLNLKALPTTDGVKEYKGTYCIDMSVELERVKGLCERWAVEWRERGSVNKPRVIDLSKEPPGIAQMRNEWNGTVPRDEE